MSGCTLQFTRDSNLRTTLFDTATGQVKYKIDTPVKLVRSVTRIRKLEADSPHDWDEESDSDDEIDLKGEKKEEEEEEEEEGNEIPELPGMSDEIARIEWHKFIPDRIIFEGKITTRSELLPACGKLKGSFMFTGPDGVDYRWALGAIGWNYPRLVTTDEEKKVIAEFHPAHHIRKKEPATLEVQPEGMHMLDKIILTFVIVEEIREQRSREAPPL